MENKPLVIMFVGKTHSGKTTVGTKLAEELGYTILDVDKIDLFIKQNYPGLVDLEMKKREFYNRESFTPFLKLLMQTSVFEYSINNGIGVVLSNGHSMKPSREYQMEVAKRLGAKVLILYMNASDDLLKERIRSAKKSIDVLTVSKSFDEVLDKQSKVFDIPSPEESDYFLEIDASGSVESIIDQVTKYIKTLE